jgi:HEAT repeat protein
MRHTQGVACVAVSLLLGCGSRAPYEGKSVAELRQMLADADPKVQAQGAYGLSLKGAEARAAVPALAAALRGKEPLVRQYAARALGRVGPGTPEAVPALTEALRGPPWEVQREAALALGLLGAEARAALPALERLRDDENRPLRQAAREAIKKIRP